MQKRESHKFRLKEVTKLVSAFALIACASHADAMQVCQMSHTLVWELERGFEVDPKEVEDYSAPYEVLMADGELLLWESDKKKRAEVLAPVQFDEHGKAERKTVNNDELWFRVSETEFRIVDREFGTVWHSKVTCPEKVSRD